MEKSSLNFPLFYQELVKQNTPLHQYDAVSILLLGKLRADCSEIVISDQMAAHYVHGKKNIRKEILSLLLQCSSEEIECRIEMLGFQDIEAVARQGLAFLESVKSVSENVKRSLQDIYYKDGACPFLSELFLTSVKSPNSASQKKIESFGMESASNIERYPSSDFWNKDSCIQIYERPVQIPDEMAYIIDLLEEIFRENPLMPFDTADILDFSNHWKNSRYYGVLFKGQCTRILQRLPSFFSRIKIDESLFVIKGFPDITLDDIEEIGHCLSDLTAGPTNMGVAIDNSLSFGYIQLIVLYRTDVNPSSKAKDTPRSKNDPFVDIEKIFEQRDAKFLEDSQPPD